MLVGHSIEQPVYILCRAHDAGKTKNLDRRIVGVYAHIHVALIANGHDSLKKVLHVGAQPGLIYSFVKVEKLAELLNGCFVVLTEVAGNEALCLYNDVFHQLMVLLRGHGLSQLITLCEDVATYAPPLREFEGSPFLTCTFALEDVNVEISKLSVVEVKVG